VQGRAEVLQPDVLPVVLQKGKQVVLLQREPNEVVDRVAEDRPDDGDDGQDEQVRDAPAGDAAAREAPPPRCPGGDRGGGVERGGTAPAQELPAYAPFRVWAMFWLAV
jgi:hypothetical protein